MTQQWKERAVSATRGSRIGAILCAAIGEKIAAPCFNGRAIITSDGYLMCDFTSADGRFHMGAFAGSASDLVDNTVRLADHLKLDANEKAELFGVIRGWIESDFSTGRALQNLKVKQ